MLKLVQTEAEICIAENGEILLKTLRGQTTYTRVVLLPSKGTLFHFNDEDIEYNEANSKRILNILMKISLDCAIKCRLSGVAISTGKPRVEATEIFID